MLRALYVDFNSYFASVEQQLCPPLRGRPVAVVPSLVDTTSCIAASVEAKHFGVKTGTRVSDARRLCPHITFIESRPEIYVEWHHILIAAVESCAPIASVNSVDEMWLRLSGSDRARANAEKLAREIKAAVARVGDWMKCSIGIAPNEFLAKTASDMMKPDGLIVIEQKDLPDALYRLKLTDFVGIGKKMHERLLTHGIGTVHALTNADAEALRKIWGGVEGERMWSKLRGADIERAPTQKASISHSHVLAPNLRTHLAAASVYSRLTQKAAMRLRHYGLVAGSIGVSMKLRDGMKWDARLPLDPTDDTRIFLAAVDQLLQQSQQLRAVRSGVPVQIGMSLGGLTELAAVTRSLFAPQSTSVTSPPRGQQTDLFARPPETDFQQSLTGREQLDRTLDALNLKFGKNTIYYGGAHKALHAAPMRIAFNHVPDLVIESDTRKQADLSLRKAMKER
jgi:DNA polymerase IV